MKVNPNHAVLLVKLLFFGTDKNFPRYNRCVNYWIEFRASFIKPMVPMVMADLLKRDTARQSINKILSLA